MYSFGLHSFKTFDSNKKGYDPWSAAPFYTMNNGKSSVILIILKLDWRKNNATPDFANRLWLFLAHRDEVRGSLCYTPVLASGPG